MRKLEVSNSNNVPNVPKQATDVKNRIRVLKYTWLFVVLFLLSPVLALAGQKTLQAKVMKVSDGDTIVVSPINGGDFFKCRLYGIDTPEGKSDVWRRGYEGTQAPYLGSGG